MRLGGGRRCEIAWYVPAALGSIRKPPHPSGGGGPTRGGVLSRPNSAGTSYRRRSRIGIAAAFAATAILALLLAACGGSDSDSEEASGTREVDVVTADFPPEQRLGETTLLRLGVRNESDEAIPALTITVSVAGEEGEGSTLPFGIRDPKPGLAQPDRPVWALAEHYPKLADSTEPGGAEGAARKTFTFGDLAAGETTEVVWKLSASRTGRYRLDYRIGAGGDVKVETATGAKPEGSFAVTITEEVPDVTVTDSGEVVEIEEPKDATK